MLCNSDYKVSFVFKYGLDMPCPLYQPRDYIQVYASIEAYHHGENVLLCVLWSLSFDTHQLLNGIARELRENDVTVLTCAS